MSALPLFALILVAFYLLVIRPQRARAKAATALKAQLAPGVDVMTTSGLFGTVTAVDDGEVRVEVSPGVVLRFLPAAIGRIVPAADQDDNDDDQGEDEADGATAEADGGTPSTEDVDTDARRTTAGE